ncbi:MAG TPA: CoA ester lyase [Anaerolineales bacterium]|nr:CoA ester lyase [Anaerolineales bacterium]HNQ95364.1 CoA ester lyase [Anaerolineales bacterium]HNS61773.1 CoA ester lyase [Anaerolineales bacterium]
MHSRRALLYMPGDDRRKIEKSTTLGVDSICMDMEDGVAANKKTEAREVIAGAMKELDFGKSERCIRINQIGSGLEKYDLAAALATNPDTIVVPKVETAEQVKWVSEHIETYELSSKLNIGSVRLLVGVETAKGIMNLKEIAEADKRLEAIIFGGEDYAASVGAIRTKEATELLYARQAVVTACAANDLQAIDIVFIDFKDPAGLRAEAEEGARFGFSGKQIIHPNQVEAAQEAFTPSDSAIEYAKRIVESFESSQKEGKGAYALDGKMIDMPLLKNAQKVLERAKAAGKAR